MTVQYLMLVEQLVRDGHSEGEIERIVADAVEEDVEARTDEPDDLPAAA
jgi:hypothetical protein